MSTCTMPAKIVSFSSLSKSKQDSVRRAICKFYTDVINKRGYQLSVQEVETEYVNLQRKANKGNLDSAQEQLAAQCGIN